jgi:hypothetical protein
MTISTNSTSYGYPTYPQRPAASAQAPASQELADDLRFGADSVMSSGGPEECCIVGAAGQAQDCNTLATTCV